MSSQKSRCGQELTLAPPDRLEEIKAMGCDAHGLACVSCVDDEDRKAAFDWLIGEVERLRRHLPVSLRMATHTVIPGLKRTRDGELATDEVLVETICWIYSCCEFEVLLRRDMPPLPVCPGCATRCLVKNAEGRQ